MLLYKRGLGLGSYTVMPETNQRPGFGLGLESTRERLAHLYGSDHFALEIATSADATTARIRIPLAAAA